MSLTLEGAVGSNFSTPATGGSVNITTGGTDRIVVVAIHNQQNTPRTVSTVTATGLTFARRKQLVYLASSAGFTQCYELWWAYASAQLTAATISVTLTGAPDDATIVAWAVAGVPSSRFSNPWDGNAALPVTNTNPTNTNVAAAANLSTSDADTIAFALWGEGISNAGNVPVTPTGYTLILQQVNTGGVFFVSKQRTNYKVYSAAQTTVSVDQGSTQNWGIILDAISGDALATNVSTTVAMTLPALVQEIDVAEAQASAIAMTLPAMTQALSDLEQEPVAIAMTLPKMTQALSVSSTNAAIAMTLFPISQVAFLNQFEGTSTQYSSWWYAA